MTKSRFVFFVLSNVCYIASSLEALDVSDLKYENNEDLYRQVFGHIDQEEEVLLDLDILIDGEIQGTIAVFLSNNSKVHVAALKKYLITVLDPEDIVIIDKYKDTNGFIELKKLEKTSLKIRINQLTMQLEVFLPLEKRPVRNFSGRSSPNNITSNVEPASFSAALNLRGSRTFSNNKHGTNQYFILTPYINIFGLCLEGEGTYSKQDDTKWHFYKNHTSLVYDFERYDVIVRAGDIFSQSNGYIRTPNMLGINIHKDVERSQIKGLVSPIRLNLLRTSTVEIYDDDHLIYTRTNVAPGTYVLDNINYRKGSNNIKIKIIDETGHEETLNESFFYEHSFVPKGEFIFNGNYGYPSSYNSLKKIYDKNNPVLSLYLKYGLLPSVEVGCGLLHVQKGHSISYMINNSNPIGYLGFELAFSKQHSLSGKAWSCHYASPSVKIFKSARLSFSTSYQQSDKFFQMNIFQQQPTIKDSVLVPEQYINSKRRSFGFYINLSNIESFNLSFGYNSHKNYQNQQTKNFSWNISRGFDVDNNWISNGNVSFNVNKQIDENKKISNSLSVYCSLSLKNNSSISSGYTKSNNSYSKYISFSQSFENFNYNTTVNKNNHSTNLNLYSHYSNSIFSCNFNHFRNNTNHNISTFGAESALYFADGQFAISRTNYSDGGFVLVAPQNELQNHKIKFLHSKKSGYIGDGAVLPNSRLSPTTARIDLKSIPDDINLDQDTIVVQGTYKRGFLAKIKGTKSTIIQGIIVDNKGEVIPKITGFAINKDNSDDSPISFFTNEEGEFTLYEAKPGNYTLNLNLTNAKPIELKIEHSNQEMLNIGTIVCEYEHE